MLQRLQVSLAQVQAGNKSENLLNEIHQIIYSYIEENKLLKSIQQYNEFSKSAIQNGYYN